jgi:FtsH-binding integral membrane protein
MKIVIIVAFILIIASLGFALVFMMKDKGKNNRMATALTFRVAFSIALFLLLLFSYKMGWIQPTGIIVGR